MYQSSRWGQRIYVHEAQYDAFVQKFVKEAKVSNLHSRNPSVLTRRQQYKLGDPTDPTVTLGPVVSLASAQRIRKQVADAGSWNIITETHHILQYFPTVAAGAKELIPSTLFPDAKEYIFLELWSLSLLPYSGTAFVAPQVLVNVNHCEWF
jgi:Aldehyde dehydrogenase family